MTESESFWGEMIEKTINFGREDNSSKLKKIVPKEIDFGYKDFTQCSHVMIYSKTTSNFMTFSSKAQILFEKEFSTEQVPLSSKRCFCPLSYMSNSSPYGDYHQRNKYAMEFSEVMQMRFDGCIGFPGGIVENGETPLQAVCREVEQEVGWTEERGAISESHYQFTHLDIENELILHFYAVEISEEKLKEIEFKLPKASNFGTEVLGHFRVPLYIMGDAFRGFPAFLKNHFVHNSKLQLIEAIVKLNLLTEEQIIQALNSAPKITY